MAHQVYCWDFTSFGVEGFAYTDVAKQLAPHCKKFVFQLELSPKTKRQHWQGRISLNVKHRMTEVKSLFEGPLAKARWSPTSQRGKATFNYVMKEDTRVSGPWNENNWKPPIVPEELKKPFTLYKWQEEIIADCKNEKENERIINVVVDKSGCIGKGFLRKYIAFHKIAKTIPTTTKPETIMAWALKFPSRAYLLDMPRGSGIKRDIIEMWRGLEQLKDGRAYETRYTPQDLEMPFAPHIWVMTNEKPDDKYLSMDRWRLWLVDPIENELIPYSEVAEVNITKYNFEKKQATKTNIAEMQRKKELTNKWRKPRKFTGPDIMPPESIEHVDDGLIDPIEILD